MINLIIVALVAAIQLFIFRKFPAGEREEPTEVVLCAAYTKPEDPADPKRNLQSC